MDKMIARGPASLAFLFFAITVTQASGQSEFRGDPSAKEFAYIDNETAVLKRRLKDPDSALFRNLYVSRKLGAPIVCGEVNAKTSFGGYLGFQRFLGASAAGIEK